MTKIIRLTEELTEEELSAIGKKWRKKHGLEVKDEDTIEGIFLTDKHYNQLIVCDADIYKPDGQPLIIFRKEILSARACEAAYPALRKAATEAGNRGAAAGLIKDDEWKIFHRRTIKATEGAQVRMKPIKKDGTLSNTSYGKNSPSGIIGYMDRNSRFPFCRLTAFNKNESDKFAQAMPLLLEINKKFKKLCPERYKVQKQRCDETSQSFIIEGTVFSTITVNRNFRTAVHKDAGDLPEGFGVMTALRAGHYSGCYLVFPKYRVAVDMHSQDLLLADVHEWHGNTPLIGIKGQYERISLVCYYRKNMIHCGTAEEEQERAKMRKKGDKLWD